MQEPGTTTYFSGLVDVSMKEGLRRSRPLSRVWLVLSRRPCSRVQGEFRCLLLVSTRVVSIVTCLRKD